MPKRYYVVLAVGDIEPELRGPYSQEDERDKDALQIRRTELPAEDGGIFWLNIDENGSPEIGAYSGGFMDGAFEAAHG